MSPLYRAYPDPTQLSIQASSSDEVPVTINGASGQTADMMDMYANASGSALQILSVNASGRLTLGGAKNQGLMFVNATASAYSITATARSALIYSNMTSAREFTFEDFSPSDPPHDNAGPIMIADGLLGTGVANGWFIDRGLTVTTLATVRPPTFASGIDVINNGMAGQAVVVGSASAFLPASGTMARIDLTTQTANASGYMTSGCDPGYYLIFSTLEVTTSQAATGNVTIAFTYTDDIGSTTQSTQVNLISQSRARSLFHCYLQSGDIVWATSAVTRTSADWAVRLRAVALA